MFDFTPLWQSWEQFWEKLLTHPEKLLQAQTQYWQDLLKLWEAPTDTPDKRFRSPVWQEDSFYHHLKEIYLLNARYLKNLVNE